MEPNTGSEAEVTTGATEQSRSSPAPAVPVAAAPSETAKMEKEQDTANREDEDGELSEGGEDAAGDEECDPDADAGDMLDPVAIEAEMGRQRAAALETLNCIRPMGQAFCTMRVLKKAGTTLRPNQDVPSPTRLSDPNGPNYNDAPAAVEAPFDLSSMLPTKSFLPVFPAPAAPLDKQDDTAPEETAPAAEAGAEEDVVLTGTASRTSPREDIAEEEGLQGQEHGAMDAVLGDKAKMMATWHYNEATEDGGVALSFGDLEGMSMNANFQELYEALNHEEEQQEEEEAAMLQEMGAQDLDGQEALQPRSSLGSVPEAADGQLEEGTAAAGSAVLPVRRSPRNSMQMPAAGAAAAMNGSLKGPGPSPITKGMMAGIKADLSRTIKAELQKSMQPTRMPSLDRQAKEAGKTLDKSIRVGFVEGKIKPINIVMLIVGTRGDVQPFVGIGLKLKEYGHRVRIASHKVYREFVTGFGLEFYPIGGDPKVLSEFVVKHRGIMPGLNIADALEQREQVKEILYSSWGACVLPDPETPNKPFIADAIIANPPAYGHTHCAEKLNVPLHIVFTMPWTPTKQFPNPFARIKTEIAGTKSKVREVMNWLSYFAVEDLAWLGMGGMVKDFRKRTLQLTDFEGKENGSHAIYHSKVPITYIWSPSLVDRPRDWPHYCEVVGFVNVDLQKLTHYTPPKELQDFLDAGPPPVYIGFGSLVVDDPVKLTRNFLDALRETGLRAIIQKGWGGLGAGVTGDVPDVLFLGAAPHDWLFKQCAAVVHHGGAGTTACGLYCGKPTFIVPFFGDQPFWGAACYKAGVGPAPVAIDDLNTKEIINALKTLMMPTCQKAAKVMQMRMMEEDGIEGTVEHLHRTIYGALLAGKTFKWMKRGASRSQVITSGIQAEEEGGFKGFFGAVKSIFGKSAAPSRNQSQGDGLFIADSPTGAAPAGRCATTAAPRSAAVPPAGAERKVRSDADIRRASAQTVAEVPQRRGIFSFLGC